MGDGTTRILQLTDLHQTARPGPVHHDLDTRASLEAVLAAALAQGDPDLLLLTGDIAQDPVPGVYDALIRLLAAHYRGRWLWTPGNHDLAAPMAEVLGRDASAPAAFADFAANGWEVIMLDTHVDDQLEGEVTDAVYRVVAARLAATVADHVLIAGHHPLVPIGTPWLDAQRVTNAAAVCDLFARSGKVRLYLCGHVHQHSDVRIDGLRMLTSPSTCYQFAPGSPWFTLDDRAPGWRWLELLPDGSIRTRIERLSASRRVT